MRHKISDILTREQQWRLSAATHPDGRPLAHRVFFEPDSLLVPHGYDPLLAAHAQFLQAHPRQVAVISGHSYGSGSHRFFWLMGERRALAVQQVLLRAGVPSRQLQIQSMGGARPMIELAGEAVGLYCRRVSIDYAEPETASTALVPSPGSAEWWHGVTGSPRSSRLPLAQGQPQHRPLTQPGRPHSRTGWA